MSDQNAREFEGCWGGMSWEDMSDEERSALLEVSGDLVAADAERFGWLAQVAEDRVPLALCFVGTRALGLSPDQMRSPAEGAALLLERATGVTRPLNATTTTTTATSCGQREAPPCTRNRFPSLSQSSSSSDSDSGSDGDVQTAGGHAASFRRIAADKIVKAVPWREVDFYARAPHWMVPFMPKFYGVEVNWNGTEKTSFGLILEDVGHPFRVRGSADYAQLDIKMGRLSVFATLLRAQRLAEREERPSGENDVLEEKVRKQLAKDVKFGAAERGYRIVGGTGLGDEATKRQHQQLEFAADPNRAIQRWLQVNFGDDWQAVATQFATALGVLHAAVRDGWCFDDVLMSGSSLLFVASKSRAARASPDEPPCGDLENRVPPLPRLFLIDFSNSLILNDMLMKEPAEREELVRGYQTGVANLERIFIEASGGRRAP